MKRTARALLPLLVTALTSWAAVSPAQEPTNLVLIALDTVRADHLGCYGSSVAETPAMDAFAREAVLFERCSAPSTWTLPSFASLFTGLFPWSHGVQGGPSRQLPLSIPTLAEILAAHGYATEEFVAVDWLTPPFGLERGFAKQHAFLEGPVTGRFEQYQAAVLQAVTQPVASPYFLFVHYYDTHSPYLPPKPYDRMYYEGDPSAPQNTSMQVVYGPSNRLHRSPQAQYRWLEGLTDIDYPVKQYAAGITHLDAQVGEVLAALKESGELDRSIVVITADHGEHLTEHDIYFTHRFPYEECLHVPLMIRLPEAEHGGRRIEQEVSLVDVLPTISELLGVPLPIAVEGRSLVPGIQGKKLEPRLNFAAYGGREENRALAAWDDRYRLIWFSQGNEQWQELYDRRKDPREARNIVAKKPDHALRLLGELKSRLRESGRQRGNTLQIPLDPEVEARLRALGYIH